VSTPQTSSADQSGGQTNSTAENSSGQIKAWILALAHSVWGRILLIGIPMLLLLEALVSLSRGMIAAEDEILILVPAIFLAVVAGVFIISPTSGLLVQKVQDCRDRKKHYLKIVENAKGDEIFKGLLLVNIAASEEYTDLTRLQAEKSFNWSITVALIGFVLVASSIGVAIYSQMTNAQININITYLTGIAGIITEFISGIFFYLYNKTLQQVDEFHGTLEAAQKTAVCLVLDSLLVGEQQRDETKMEIVKALLASLQPQQGQAAVQGSSVLAAPVTQPHPSGSSTNGIAVETAANGHADSGHSIA
jgi:TRADD-N domain-containing protein